MKQLTKHNLLLNKSFIIKIFIFLLPLLISSCAQVYYPSHINSSFIENKGETNIGGAISLTSVNLQASHSVTPHLRLAGGVNAWAWSFLGDGQAGLQTQLLTGYYKKLGNKVFFEGYGGIGFSIANEDFFSHGIIQPSLGFGKDRAKFIVSLRANYLDNSLFSDPNSGVILGPGETNKISGMQYDFAFTHRFVKENKTWFFQYGLSGGDIQRELGDNPFMTFINFGLNLRLFSKNYNATGIN